MMSRKRGCVTIIWVIDLWIELGLPDERRIKKACTQAAEVALFAYNSRAAQIWWQQNQSKCAQFANLSVWYLDDEQLAKVSAFCRSYHDAAGNDSGWCYLVIG